MEEKTKSYSVKWKNPLGGTNNGINNTLRVES